MNRWGKEKIRKGLAQHGVSPYNIKSALRQLSRDDYLGVLRRVTKEKRTQLQGKGTLIEQRQKVTRFLLQRGFAHTDINGVWEVSEEDHL